MQGGIFSAVLLAGAFAAQGTLGNPAYMLADTEAVNVVDMAFSSVLIAAFLIALVGHAALANAVHSMPVLAGGLHSALSNATSVVPFLCAFTYAALYADSCLLKVPAAGMCDALFRTTPIPYALVGAVSALLFVVLLISIALCFVSTPEVRSAGPLSLSHSLLYYCLCPVSAPPKAP